MRCNVYLIKAVIEDVIQYKIGLSKHPQKRILELKTANPNIIDVVVQFETKNREYASFIERSLHNYYKFNSIDGEWFKEIDYVEFVQLCKKFEHIAISCSNYEQI